MILFIYLFVRFCESAQTCQSHVLAWWPALDFTGCLAGRCLREGVPRYCLLEKIPLGQPSGNNITHTERSWCQGQLSCKDVGDGRHVLIFHFVGVSEHVAAGRGCNEADRRREAAPPARHPPAEEPPDTSRTINGRRSRRMAPTCPCFCTSGSPDGDDPSGGG